MEPDFSDGEEADDQVERARIKRRKLEAAIRRRRALIVLHRMRAQRRQGPQGPKRREKTTFSWRDHLARLTEKDFRLRYRLDIDSFYKLLGIIRGDIETKDKRKAKNAKWGRVIGAEEKLAMALRYMAGGSFLDIKLIYHVENSYIYDSVWSVVDAVNKHLKVEFPIDDVQKLQVLEAEFRAASRGGIWEGQVGAVDGVHFGMRAPSLKDVPDPMRYYVPRKAEYALLCMAMCDARRRITYYDIRQAPTTHDSLAWACSKLGQQIAARQLCAPFFVSGDSAFNLTNSMIVPSGDPELDDFDFHQSSNRMPIECAFGVLVKRWGILWRKLQVRFDRRAALIGALIRLHNFCITHRVTEMTYKEKDGFSKILPNRWEKTPLFDKEGRPVHYLNIERGVCLRHAVICA